MASWSGGGNGPDVVVEGGGTGCGQDVRTSSDPGCASIGTSPPQAAYPWIKVGDQMEACTKGVHMHMYASIHCVCSYLSAVV